MQLKKLDTITLVNTIPQLMKTGGEIWCEMDFPLVNVGVNPEINTDYCKENNILVTYEKKVPYIINRAGDGQCPVEKCVQGIYDSKEAYERIKETVDLLAKQ